MLEDHSKVRAKVDEWIEEPVVEGILILCQNTGFIELTQVLNLLIPLVYCKLSWRIRETCVRENEVVIVNWVQIDLTIHGELLWESVIEPLWLRIGWEVSSDWYCVFSEGVTSPVVTIWKLSQDHLLERPPVDFMRTTKLLIRSIVCLIELLECWVSSWAIDVRPEFKRWQISVSGIVLTKCTSLYSCIIGEDVGALVVGVSPWHVLLHLNEFIGWWLYECKTVKVRSAKTLNNLKLAYRLWEIVSIVDKAELWGTN